MLHLIVNPDITDPAPLAAIAAARQAAVVITTESPDGHPFPAAGYFVKRICNGEATGYFDGPLTLAQVNAIPECIVDVNRAALVAKANTALTSNATYIARTAPTTAQNTAQIKALSLQLDALIRLVGGFLDSTSGT